MLIEWAACLPEKRGDRSDNHGCKSRRDGWWDLKSHCRIQYGDELGLDIKNVLRERNGAFVTSQASAERSRQMSLDSAHRR